MRLSLYSYAFDFRQVGAFVIATLRLGSAIRDVAIVVLDAYTDPAAVVRIGVAADPSAIMRGSDSVLRVAGEYRSLETRVGTVAMGFYAPIILTLTPHASPRGMGRVFYTLEDS